jgi:hypothetical protein
MFLAPNKGKGNRKGTGLSLLIVGCIGKGTPKSAVKLKYLISKNGDCKLFIQFLSK